MLILLVWASKEVSHYDIHPFPGIGSVWLGWVRVAVMNADSWGVDGSRRRGTGSGATGVAERVQNRSWGKFGRFAF